MHGPWQRLMWYSRHGRWSARSPSRMSIVQVRNGNRRRTRFIDSSTLDADAYGPEVAAPVVHELAGALDAREVVAQGDLDVRVALVVLEADVEARLEALDEVGLEEQRLADAVDLGDLDVGDPVDDRSGCGGSRRRAPASASSCARGCAGSGPCRRTGRRPARPSCRYTPGRSGSRLRVASRSGVTPRC